MKVCKMSGNTIGKIFSLTTFGESHGIALGGVIDGCPANLKMDMNFISDELQRRRTGMNKLMSSRSEDDKVEFLSGLMNGVTTGTPLAFIILNKDHRSSDYSGLKDIFRPSHADYTYLMKYGIRDYQGGGRASARETVARVVAGAIAKMILKKKNISIHAFTSQVGNICIDKKGMKNINYKKTENDILFCPDAKASDKMQTYLENIKKQGDTIGGVVSCIITGCPVGLGEPVFDKLHAELAKAMMTIPAAKGFEYGEGFAVAAMNGSEHNDAFIFEKKKVKLATNHAGGILGGISNGENIFFNVAFKPIPSIGKAQKTINEKGVPKEIKIKGRHDVCVIPRVVPVVEAMAALTIVDHLFRNNSYNQ